MTARSGGRDKRLLSLLTGRIVPGGPLRPKALRGVLPEQRTRSHDMRRVIEGWSTAAARSGAARRLRPRRAHRAGAPRRPADRHPRQQPAAPGRRDRAGAADKAARFMRLCDAHGLAMVSLIDTPGHGRARDRSEGADCDTSRRMFVAAAHLRVPFLALVLRKARPGRDGDGRRWLHARAGHRRLAEQRVRSMGLGGAVRLGYHKELRRCPKARARGALSRAAGAPGGRGPRSIWRRRWDRYRHRPGAHARMVAAPARRRSRARAQLARALHDPW